ncbi:sigma-70 family RNA polymerase sigma factor [Nonomuraea maritima]|uniref:sigma-70 family RNA polymerase sigma factor n=1 Tax=Nonomuraea maritima TaxID=683260 RepID=UPI00372490F7
MSALEQAAGTFMELGPRLFGIAYRVVRCASEAEDVLQDVWVRWQHTDRSAVRNDAAYLSLVTTRLAINVASSARRRRETNAEPWFHELVATGDDPTLAVERDEDLERALVLLVERLTPAERAVYVLREAFVHPYTRIAELLHLSPVNVRQVLSRARRRLATARRGPARTVEHRRLLAAFLAAARTGDVAALETLLVADVRGAARLPRAA